MGPETPFVSPPPPPSPPSVGIVSTTRSCETGPPRARQTCGGEGDALPFVHLAMRQLPPAHRHHLDSLSCLLQRANGTRSPPNALSSHASSTCSCAPVWEKEKKNNNNSKTSKTNNKNKEEEARGEHEILVACHMIVRTPAGSANVESAAAPLAVMHHSNNTDDDAAASVKTNTSTITGINFTTHRLLHPAPTSIFRGLLKGCAEQNVLGALAAGGYNYIHDTIALYLVAGIRQAQGPHRDADEGWGESDTRQRQRKGGPVRVAYPHRSHGNETPILQPHSPFPCPQCWQYLIEMGQMKHELGLPPLQIWVRVRKVGDLWPLTVHERLREAEQWRRKKAEKAARQRRGIVNRPHSHTASCGDANYLHASSQPQSLSYNEKETKWERVQTPIFNVDASPGLSLYFVTCD